MTGKDLKNSILQLAIQGKLVEQRVEEGSAKELLKKIEAEKKLLIKEGKIKKQPKLPEITEDEKPFDIPESWEWVRLGDLIHNWGQKKPNKTFDYIDVGSIDNKNGRLSQNENLLEPKDAPSRARKIVKEGTVLYSTVRPYLLNICIIDKDFKHEPIASTAFAVLHPMNGLFNKYLYFTLNSPMFNTYVNSVMIGVAYPAINDKNLLNGLIPLPPFEEQKRIVAKIEELMPLVEKYDQVYSELEELNKKFPEDMQKSILQYAIQGKLVEQREEEGTAEDLYKQIQEEKKKLIKEGRIKKQEKLPEIADDEKPFDIPESWKWFRLGEIVSVNGGKRIPAGRSLTDVDTGYKYIRVADMKNGSIMLDNIKYVPEDIYPKIKNYTISKDDIYITVAGTIGQVGLVPNELDNANLTENADKLTTYFNCREYIYYMLSSNLVQQQIREFTTKVGQPKLAIKRINDLIVPLPPLEEQKRIVAKIEELLPYCQQLIK